MKRFQWILASLFLVGFSALGDCGKMPVGYHEFAIFGANHHVYVSHYPTFSSIHAYQVLLEVELSADDHDAEKKLLEHLAAHPELRYTYSPYRKLAPAADRVKDQEDWVLPDKSRVGAVMNGDIHYRVDQKDTTLDFNVTAKVTHVIQNRILSPGEVRPPSLTYIYFGDASGGFLAHYVSAPPNPGEQKPDFDQILAVAPLSPSQTLIERDLYSLPGRPNEKASKLATGETATLTGTRGESVPVKVTGEIFTHGISTDR